MSQSLLSFCLLNQKGEAANALNFLLCRVARTRLVFAARRFNPFALPGEATCRPLNGCMRIETATRSGSSYRSHCWGIQDVGKTL